MPYEEIVDIEIAENVLIRFSRSGRPIARYSVVLLLLFDDIWEEVRLFDNHLDDHHMHRYTRSEGKQPPETFHLRPDECRDSRGDRSSESPLGGDHRIMEKLAVSSNTPATDAGFELLTRIAIDPVNDDRYPSGTVLIPSDSSHVSQGIARAIEERRPIALVFPDGSDIVARPPAGHGLALLLAVRLLAIVEVLGHKRDRPTFVPRQWVTEFHAARATRAPQSIA